MKQQSLYQISQTFSLIHKPWWEQDHYDYVTTTWQLLETNNTEW